MRLLFCALFLLSGCASHKLRCDAHLLPINPPAPAPAPAQGAAAPPQGAR
jgi:uncharacterized lipoprotein YmbA